MVLCGFPMNTEKVSMLLQKSEPESLLGSHCFIRKVQGSRHFGLRDMVRPREAEIWLICAGPHAFLPGRAHARSHSSTRQLQGGERMARQEKR